MRILSILQKIPEYYLLVAAVLASYTPPFSFNYLFITLAGIVLLQIIFKNSISGVILGALFFLANLFFLGAIISEFIEFVKFNSEALSLLLVGIPLFILNVVLSVTMISKHSGIALSRQPEI